jgi:hypothetical protein
MSEKPATAPPEIPIGRLRRARMLRRIGLGVVGAFVLAGSIGAFGIRTGTVTGSGGGYDLSLAYPLTDRSSMPIHWVLTVRRPGGFGKSVDVGLTRSYLDLLDINDIEPEPSGSRDVGDMVVWTFDPPVGDTLVVSLDGQIQMNTLFGSGATVSVLEGQRPVASLHYRTWTAP